MTAMLGAFSIPVIRYAFWGMLIAGGSFSLLGVIIVSLNLSAIRFTLMHVGLLGAAIGLALGFSSGAGAFALVMAASLAMGLSGKALSISSNSAMGLFMTGSLAGAFLLLSASGVPAMDVFGVFAGNILLLTKADLALVAALGAVILLAFALARREIQLTLLDAELARAMGVPVDAVQTGLFLLVGAGVGAALKLVGALLVDAVILLPGIAALRFAKSFGQALVLSSLFGMASCAAGFAGALFLDLPIGASAAAAASILLAASIAASKIWNRR